MTHEEFMQLQRAGYNRIPIQVELLTDTETPLSVFLKLANEPNSYLLESVQGGERWGRYSIIGLPCRGVLKVTGYDVQLVQDGQVIESHTCTDPLAYVASFKARYRIPNLPNLPRFNGGLVGFFSYDCARYVETKLVTGEKEDPLGTPDIALMISDSVVVFDNWLNRVHVIVLADAEHEEGFAQGWQRLQSLLKRLKQPLTTSLALPIDYDRMEQERLQLPFTSSFTQSDYEACVTHIQQYILAGDCMQVVPSQRMMMDFKWPPLMLYRALRALNPTPYLFYLHFEDFHVVGSSPEVLVRVEGSEVTVRPIAGTRPRGKTPEEDALLEQDLLSDEKELAEHLMLIDLGRNDVGRISVTGSVKVTDRMVIERYSNVMHIVSNVRGQLRPELNSMDALRAILPAGTLSGAPKIRSMQIIAEVEPYKRGIYGGAVGYWSWNGNMDTAIAIRTAVIKDQKLYIQAGGGIVADSIPASEWQETINKRLAMFQAVALVRQMNEVNPCS